MSKTASRPDDQPNHRRTARKVSRASSSPGSTARSTSVTSLTWARTSSELTASRTADVAKPSMSSQPLSSATYSASGTKSRERVDARLGDRTGVVEVLGQAQRLLVGVGRQRARRHRGRPPRAGGPCWIRCRGRPGARGQPLRLEALATRARSRPRVSPCLRRVRRPRRRGAGLPLRPDLADLDLHLHLRQRVPGHLRRLPRRRLLHPRCALQRRGRRAARRVVRRAAHAGAVAVPPAATVETDDWVETDEDGERKTVALGTTARLRLPQPCRLRHRRGLRPARPGPRAGAQLRSRPSPTSAGSCRSGAPTATSSARTARLPRDHDREYDRARLGTRRPRPRLVLLGQHRGPRRAGAGLRHQRARADRADGRRRRYDELVRHCDAHVRSRSALALHPADPR